MDALTPPQLLPTSIIVSDLFRELPLISTNIREGSWSNQVGAWQWYIHGNASTDNYLGLSPDHKNPADTSDAQGVRITIVGYIPSSREMEADNSQDGTSFWNGQDMERSELIPQTKADLGSGHLFYHFSLKTEDTNAPNPSFEHQIAFFEVTTPRPMYRRKQQLTCISTTEPFHRAQVRHCERRFGQRQHPPLVRWWRLPLGNSVESRKLVQLRL